MATMKDISRLADISLSTVSIVLNGQGNDRNISKITQDKIWKIAAELNYTPNVAAKRLRKGSENRTTILIFWASDFRASMIPRFMRGLTEGLSMIETPVDLMFHFYEEGKLEQSDAFLSPSVCNAAIICNTTSVDLNYLESKDFLIPIVLYNRVSEKYCTVTVNQEDLGSLPAKAFLTKKYKSYVLIKSTHKFPGSEVRGDAFVNTLLDNKISKTKIHVLESENTMNGAFNTLNNALNNLQLPAAVYCTSDNIAIGSLRAIYKNDLNCPSEISLISLGNGDPEVEENLFISLSVAELPMEAMAKSCLDMAHDLLNQKITEPVRQTLDVKMIYRESFQH